MAARERGSDSAPSPSAVLAGVNPIEGVWKATKKRTTHNRFSHTTTERDAALVSTFRAFQAYPAMISGHTDRFL